VATADHGKGHNVMLLALNSREEEHFKVSQDTGNTEILGIESQSGERDSRPQPVVVKHIFGVIPWQR